MPSSCKNCMDFYKEICDMGVIWGNLIGYWTRVDYTGNFGFSRKKFFGDKKIQVIFKNIYDVVVDVVSLQFSVNFNRNGV